MHKTFATPQPVALYVELGSGSLSLAADDVDHTSVTVEGHGADDTVVEQRGDQVVVVAPSQRGGLFGRPHELTVAVAVPTDSAVATKLGSADLVSTGRLGPLRLRSGSGDLQVEEAGAEAVIETGSGDVQIRVTRGDLRVKTGSGDVQVRIVEDTAVINTGSGDVQLGRTADTVVVKSGSGDIAVREALTDVSATTASGDLAVDTIHRGTVKAKCVSGDVRVGVPAGIPVWTDVSSVSGDIASTLQPAGEPDEGQDYVEIRATTVSGDISLDQR